MKSSLDKICLLQEAEVVWHTRSKAGLDFVCSCLQNFLQLVFAEEIELYFAFTFLVFLILVKIVIAK